MKILAKFGMLCALLMLGLLGMGQAQAQATRTWVSGVGDDANPCSRTAPCKTFQGTIAKTAAGGVIDVLDPGGFGAVTITKSITIENIGAIGSVLVVGTNGIIVNDGGAGTAVVTLRGLSLEGMGLSTSGAGLRGVYFISGKELIVERCDIGNFTDASNGAGIAFVPSTPAKLVVRDTTLHNNGGSGGATAAILVRPSATGGTVQATLSDVRIVDGTSSGIVADGANGAITMLIRNSAVSGFAANGILAMGGTGAVSVTLAGSTVSGNTQTGLLAQPSAMRGAPLAQIRMTDSTITGNATGVQNGGAGSSIASFGNNSLYGNTIDGSVDTHVTLQ